MRQAQIPRYGPPEDLKVVESKDPEPKAAAAHAFIQARKNLGKVLLRPL